MEEFEAVLRTPELGPGDLAAVQAHGREVAIANVGQTYYAVEARCPVDGTNLGRDGRLDGDEIVCPNDQARFDVRTGARIGNGGPPLRPHAIKVHGNEVLVGPPRVSDQG